MEPAGAPTTGAAAAKAAVEVATRNSRRVGFLTDISVSNGSSGKSSIGDSLSLSKRGLVMKRFIATVLSAFGVALPLMAQGNQAGLGPAETTLRVNIRAVLVDVLAADGSRGP